MKLGTSDWFGPHFGGYPGFRQTVAQRLRQPLSKTSEMRRLL